MYAVLGAPFLPLLKHIHHVAAILMQSQEKPPKSSHAVQEKVAQLLEEFAIQEWQGNRVKAGKNFRMFRNQRMVRKLLRPSAIGHIGDTVIQDERISVLLLDGGIRQRRQDAEL